MFVVISPKLQHVSSSFCLLRGRTGFVALTAYKKRARNIYATRLPITKWRIKEITANTSNRWISPPATWNTVKPPSQAISSTTNKLSIYSWSFLLLVRKHCQIPGRTVCLTGCRSSEHQATSRRGTPVSSPLASPVEEISSAPVRSSISFALFVWSELSE